MNCYTFIYATGFLVYSTILCRWFWYKPKDKKGFHEISHFASFFSNSSTFRLLLILLIFNYQLAPNSSSKMHMYLVDLFSSIFWTLYREAIQKKKKKDTLDKRLFYYKTSTFLCYSWDYRYVLLVPIVTCYLYLQKNLWSSSRHSKTIIYET